MHFFLSFSVRSTICPTSLHIFRFFSCALSILKWSFKFSCYIIWILMFMIFLKFSSPLDCFVLSSIDSKILLICSYSLILAKFSFTFHMGLSFVVFLNILNYGLLCIVSFDCIMLLFSLLLELGFDEFLRDHLSFVLYDMYLFMLSDSRLVLVWNFMLLCMFFVVLKAIVDFDTDL